MDAIGHSSVGGEAIATGRVKQTLNPLEHPALANTMYQGRPLSQILATDGQREEFLFKLLGYDAFMKIFGKTVSPVSANFGITIWSFVKTLNPMIPEIS